MKVLRDACQHLAVGERTVRFSDLDGVSLSRNVGSIGLRLNGADGLCRHAGHPLAFVFDGDRAQWRARVLLLDPLALPGSPGTFQLLEPNAAEASVSRRPSLGS